MKKMICFVLAVLVMVFSSVSVFAGAAGVQSELISVQPRYTIINTIAAGLAIDSSGKATCSGRLVSGSSGSDCYISIELQQKSNNQWNTIKTWTASKLNASSVSLEKNYYVVHGTYRVKLTGTIENSELGVEETAVKYSKTVEY